MSSFGIVSHLCSISLIVFPLKSSGLTQKFSPKNWDAWKIKKSCHYILCKGIIGIITIMIIYIFDLCVAHLRVQKQEERAGAGDVVLRRHHPRDPQQGDALEMRSEKGETSLRVNINLDVKVIREG